MKEENKNIEIRDLRNGNWYWIHKIVYEEYSTKIGAIGLSVYNALCFYANQEGQCYPSIKTIAKKLNVSAPTIHKYLKKLEKYKLIKIINRQKENQSNIYTLVKLVNKDSKGGLQGLIKEVNTNKKYINNNKEQDYSKNRKTYKNIRDKLAKKMSINE